MRRMKNEYMKIVIVTIFILLGFSMLFFIVRSLLIKDNYFFQISEESKWVVNEARIEFGSQTNKFFRNGVIYTSNEELWLGDYTYNIFLNYKDSSLGRFYIDMSHVSKVDVPFDEVYYGYNLGGIGYHTFDSVDVSLLDLQTVYLEVIYNYDDKDVVDVVPITLSKNYIGNNQLPSAYASSKKRNLVTAYSNQNDDLFWIGMSEEDVDYIIEELSVINTGYHMFEQGRRVVSFGYKSEITVQIEDNEVVYIDIFSEHGVSDDLGFDSNMKDYIDRFGTNYQKFDNGSGTEMIEYNMNGYYVSFVFSYDELVIWSLSKTSKFEE